MDHVQLGRAGVRVSRLCLGTMNFGPYTPEVEAHAILDAAREAGVNFVDTANVYGRRRGEGVTESILGRWFAQGGGRREDTVLATKVFGAMGKGPNDRGLSAVHLRRALQASLERLRTDRVDLWQMHHVAREVTWEEIWQEMERAVLAGQVVYVGASNFAGWHLVQACESARARNLLGLVSEQSLYNLTQRTVELEVLPACRRYGLGLIPWSPLAGGLLGGSGEKGGRREDRLAKEGAAASGRLERWERFCAERGHPPGRMALAWLLHQEGVTAPIIGPRTLAQLEDALAALEIRLAPEDLTALEELFPGPGGAAPEAYAW